jgi:hypothetical protein
MALDPNETLLGRVDSSKWQSKPKGHRCWRRRSQDNHRCLSVHLDEHVWPDPSGMMIGVMDPRNRYIFTTNCVEIGLGDRVRIFQPEKTIEDFNYCRFFANRGNVSWSRGHGRKIWLLRCVLRGEISEDMSREICLGFLEFMVATSGASEVRLMETRVFVPPAYLSKSWRLLHCED